MKGNVGRRWRMIRCFLTGHIKWFARVIIWSMLATILGSLTPQIIRFTVDSVVGDKPFALPAFLGDPLTRLGGQAFLRAHLYIIFAAIVLTALANALCTYCSRVDTTRGSEGFVKTMRDKLFAHIGRLPYSWHVQNQTGDIIQRCTSDVEVVKDFVSGQLLEVFRTSFLVIWALIMMFSMNVRLSLIAMIFIPIVLLYSAIFYRKIGKKFRVADEAEGELSNIAQENLTGVRVVRAFGKEAAEIDKFKTQNHTYSNLWIKLGYLLGSYWGLGDLITGLQVMVVLVAGTVMAVNGNLTVGELLAFISYNSTLIWPIRSLGRTLSEMSKAGVSVDRLAYIWEAEEETDAADAEKPEVHGALTFEHVSFRYPDGSAVLHDLNFTVPAGKTYAVLGATGSGKSTLMHLLVRLYELPPESGRILLDGHDIAKIDRHYLREHVGIVLQEPFLYSRTIAENIAIKFPNADREKIRTAARIAAVDEAIEEFTDGYETVVGERGVTLSGGQKQRVAMARMLMQNASVMIFDDSLSAVDAETDEKIRNALLSMPTKATKLIISHRVTTLMQADCIVVLEKGKIAEMGSHKELLAENGIYKRIYDIQRADEE